MNKQKKITNFIKKSREVFFRIEQRVPYIPDFSNAWNIVKILLMSISLCVMYSFSEVKNASNFYMAFIPNIQIFIPYVITQLLLLIFFSKIILKTKPFVAILIIVILNFITVLFVHSVISKSWFGFMSDLDSMLSQFFLSFGILFFFLIYFDWRDKIVDPAHTMAKLIFLQAKMKPHFLFNTLNSVISLMKKEPDTARKMLLNLSELLRASLKEEEVSMYSLKEEVTLCKRYLDIEKIRLGERLNIEWDIDESILVYKVPRLCLQPLIENSVLHGVQNIENGGTIHISIKSKGEDSISIEIKNPIGKKVSYNNEKHNNISTSNLKERLKIYFDGNIEFKCENRNEYFYVSILIPQKQ